MNMKITMREVRSLWPFMVRENPKCHAAMALLGVPVGPDWQVPAQGRPVAQLLRAMADAIDQHYEHSGPPAKPEQGSETPDF